MYGGVRADGARRHYREMMAQFREDYRHGEFKSGVRSGESEEVQRDLSDLMHDEDDLKANKSGKKEETLRRESHQAERGRQV